MTAPDPVLVRLHEGIQLRLGGRRLDARALMDELWDEIGGPDGNPLHRCSIAHSLADVQDDLERELRWDLAALDAAREVTDRDVAAAGMPGPAAALLPSLHLNLADCHRRRGHLHAARSHVEQAAQHLDALPSGDYGDTVRAAVRDLGGRLTP